MPPKVAGPSKKTEQKKKEKVLEDKTFGMKNKKGAKQQKLIQQIQKQVTGTSKKQEEAKRELETRKKEKEKEKKELNTLFRPVVTQKIDKGTDPKSVVCAFFKQGQCAKGNKCKFSHDMNVERKGEKRSAYHDMRSEEENMEDWDDEKLREVVDQKHGETNSKRTETKIICKYFLDALENSKYGWFWECPNGEKCIYKHALPPGFVLKKDKKKEDKKEEISIEDLIERERAALGSDLTKVTFESFIAWKRRKIKERIEANRRVQDKKKADFTSGHCIGLSGRDMFTFNPEMANEDQADEGGEAFDTSLFREEDMEDTQVKEVNFDFEYGEEPSKTAEEKSNADSPINVPIDENLFAEDDEDLDELEEHLEALDVS